jgi:hypothetical protein
VRLILLPAASHPVPLPHTQAALEPAGCLGDLGWYCIRWALWAYGWDLPSHAAAVFHRATKEGVPTEVTAELTWADGRTASFDCGFHTCLRQVRAFPLLLHRPPLLPPPATPLSLRALSRRLVPCPAG